ncbi:MAG: family 16 glycosylhydrolase [Bacteroidales bacterium]|nr:family 16 glycosylhydrolase [Bacteroidales bacterium]
MKTIYIIPISALLGLMPMLTFTQNIVDGYVTVFEDHFDEFDESKWDLIFPWGYFLDPHISSYYRHDEFGHNHIINNGCLELLTKMENYTGLVTQYKNDQVLYYYVNFIYTSGMIYSKRNFTGGYYMINCKVPQESTLTSAFWLYGRCQQEIDVYEIWDGPGLQKTNYHFCYTQQCVNQCSDGGDMPLNHPQTPPLSNDFHRFGSSWNLDNKIITYVLDGSTLRLIDDLCLNSSGQKVPCINGYYIGTIYPNRKMNIVANIAVINNHETDQSSETDDVIGKLQIDYIKVLYPIDCDEIKSVCSYCTDDIFNICPSVITGKEVTLGGCQNSTMIIPATDINSDKNYLDIFATERIIIKKGFLAKNGCYFRARITDCPGDETSELISKSLLNDENVLQNDFLHSGERMPIYPNPVKSGESLNIDLPDIIRISIFDEKSHFIDHISHCNVINTQNLSKGFYIIHIITKNSFNIAKLIVL